MKSFVIDSFKNYVQFFASVHLLLSIVLVLIEEFLLTEVGIWRNFQFELQILLQKQSFSYFFLLLLLLHVDRILIKIVLGIEVSPHCKSQDYCFFYPTQETLPQIFRTNIGMKSKKTTKSKSPFYRSESIRVPENVLSLQVIHFFYGQAIIFDLHL